MGFKTSRFFSLLVVFLGFWNFSQAEAAGDTLSPTKISFQVSQGEEFSYDLSFFSLNGGVYDMLGKSFSYDEAGGQQDAPDTYVSLVSFPEPRFGMAAGEERYVQVVVSIPELTADQDIYLGVFIRKRADYDVTYELGSLLFLRVGEAENFSGSIADTAIKYVGDSGTSIEMVTFNFENNTDRYFEVLSELHFFDLLGNKYKKIQGPSTMVFPEFNKTINVINFSNEDFIFDNSFSLAKLLVYSEDAAVLDEAKLDFKKGDIMIHQEKTESPVRQFRLRKHFKFLYNPIFQGLAIILGLTLMAYSFSLRKK